MSIDDQSIAFKAGADAARQKKSLHSSIRNLMAGTQRYYDFIDGYDSVKEAKEKKK